MGTSDSLRPHGVPDALFWLVVGDSEHSWAPGAAGPRPRFPAWSLAHERGLDAQGARTRGSGAGKQWNQNLNPNGLTAGNVLVITFLRGLAAQRPDGASPRPSGPRRHGTKPLFVGSCCGAAGQEPLVLRALRVRGKPTPHAAARAAAACVCPSAAGKVHTRSTKERFGREANASCSRARGRCPVAFRPGVGDKDQLSPRRRSSGDRSGGSRPTARPPGRFPRACLERPVSRLPAQAPGVSDARAPAGTYVRAHGVFPTARVDRTAGSVGIGCCQNPARRTGGRAHRQHKPQVKSEYS